MGGEGGGVLADWLVDAATVAQYPVQSTSVPGVAQRTGATTYYIEIFPQSLRSLEGREPVLSLTPTSGQVDVVAASELVEAGRAIHNGYVDPLRTTLVASTHREYAVSEKAAMGDGRFDEGLVLQAASARAKRAVLMDMRALASRERTVINTVLFGAMCGAGVLPFDRAACEDAIRRSGKAVDASLRGFAAGFAGAAGRVQAADGLERTIREATAPPPRVAKLPEPLHAIVMEGVALTTDYQDASYAEHYLGLVEQVVQREQLTGGLDFGVSKEFARYLALWMSYEDVIRVAQLKTRRLRLTRVRAEVGAKPDEPVRMTEYLKPGLDEIASIMPPRIAAWLRKRAAGRGWHRGMYIRTDTVGGFLMLCSLRVLRPLRRITSRYVEEHAAIARWQSAVEAALGTGAALELALSGNLVKGYGETSRRGHKNLETILTLAGSGADPQQLRAARIAALGDPEGRQLAAVVGAAPPQPIRIVRRRSAG